MVNYQNLTRKLAWTKAQGPRAMVQGYWDHFLFQNDFNKGGRPQGAGGGSWIADLYSGFDGVNGMQV